MTKLSEHELGQIRDIRIHKILGVKDDGRRIQIKCVFHRDHTPSLTIYPANDYYCFGCNKSGKGAIDFCRDLGYSFTDAVKELIRYIKVED